MTRAYQLPCKLRFNSTPFVGFNLFFFTFHHFDTKTANVNRQPSTVNKCRNIINSQLYTISSRNIINYRQKTRFFACSVTADQPEPLLISLTADKRARLLVAQLTPPVPTRPHHRSLLPQCLNAAAELWRQKTWSWAPLSLQEGHRLEC